MRRIIAFIFQLALIIILCACGSIFDTGGAASPDESVINTENVNESEDTAAPTEVAKADDGGNGLTLASDSDKSVDAPETSKSVDVSETSTQAAQPLEPWGGADAASASGKKTSSNSKTDSGDKHGSNPLNALGSFLAQATATQDANAVEGATGAEYQTESQYTPVFPQIDCSTARIPITNAVYELFTGKYGYEGPAPICSKTHGAWLNLADRIADILFLVAPTDDELAYLASKNVDIEMKVYGYDGLVFIGNESNPVKNLSSKAIRDIYSGKITNWRDVGGENADIVVYIRNPESGSQRLFESLVWEGYDMPDFSRMGFRESETIDPRVTQRSAQTIVDNGMESITQNVLLNQYAIGFNIMSYIDEEFAGSSLKLFAVNGYMPATENFTSGKYPYLTTSYVAIRADEPAGSPARALYDWVGSQESYGIIERNSTLTVSFSDSLVVRAGEAMPRRGFSDEGVETETGGGYVNGDGYGFTGGNGGGNNGAGGFGDNGGNNGAGGGYGGFSYEKEDISDMILKLNRQYITRGDLLQYDAEDAAFLRNGIFALSGKIFKTKKYSDYFSGQYWYYGYETDDNAVQIRFNDYQKKNLAVIMEYEKEFK